MHIIFTRIGCTLFTCDMYMCRLRHISDPVLSSLKMEGIRLIFITERKCVYCAVRSGCLNIMWVNLSKRSAHSVYLRVFKDFRKKNSVYFPTQP
jgi:hypothetical protein